MGQLDRDWYHDRDNRNQPTEQQQNLTDADKAQLQERLKPTKPPFRLKFKHAIGFLALVLLGLLIGILKR